MIQNSSKVDHAYLRGIESCMQLIKNCKHCPVIQSAAFDVLLTAPCNHFDNFNALRLIEGLQHEEFCYKVCCF